MRCAGGRRLFLPSGRLRAPATGSWSKRWHLRGDRDRTLLLQKRHFGLESLPAILVPPAVFGGLLVTLWAYKCLMMVVFQNKIIYMPSVPPFSRSEKVSDYASQC